MRFSLVLFVALLSSAAAFVWVEALNDIRTNADYHDLTLGIAIITTGIVIAGIVVAVIDEEEAQR